VNTTKKRGRRGNSKNTADEEWLENEDREIRKKALTVNSVIQLKGK